MPDAFIRRWQGPEGGQERVGPGCSGVEFYDALGLDRPEPGAVLISLYRLGLAVTGDGGASSARRRVG